MNEETYDFINKLLEIDREAKVMLAEKLAEQNKRIIDLELLLEKAINTQTEFINTFGVLIANITENGAGTI